MLLCLDTETTGLPDWRSPSDAEHQPHLVQLAMVLMEEDFTERASVSVIIKPDGWIIPDEVAAIHGITTEIASKVGIPEKTATMLYASLLYDTGAMVVGHNVAFDLRIMRIALLRAGFTKDKLDARPVKSFCTLGASTALVNLPPTPKMVAAGFNKPKAPKLSECIFHFFGEELVGAHDAMVDVRAAVRVYRHLQRPAAVEPVADVI